MGGGTHLLPWEGVGGPNSGEGTESPVLYVYYNPFMVNIELDMFISNILCKHQFYFFFTLQYFFTVYEYCDMRTNLDDETYTFLHGSVIYLSILRCNFCENIEYTISPFSVFFYNAYFDSAHSPNAPIFIPRILL